MFEIVDRMTGRVVSTTKTRRGAMRAVDRRDNAHGAYRFYYRDTVMHAPLGRVFVVGELCYCQCGAPWPCSKARTIPGGTHMDPNANLVELRRLVSRMIAQQDASESIDQDDAARMCDLIEALDGWLSAGGFLPQAWQRR